MSGAVPASTRRYTIGMIGGAGVMLAFGLPLCWYFASRAGHTLLENYNEGWNALYIDRVLTGGTLYPGADEWLLNNYPPLSFVLVAAASALFGDAMTSGRLVSVIAFAVLCALIGLIVGQRTTKAAGIFAASFFVLLFACFPGQRIGLNDPQLLAHAFMALGLAAVWLAPERAQTVALGAAFMVLGGMTKHNLIAVPLATSVWMAWRGRRSAMLWVGSCAVAGALGFAAMLAIGGAPMLHSMLAPRHASIAHALAYSRKLVALIDVPLVAAVVGVAVIKRRSDQVMAGSLLAAALFEMVAFAGGDGVVANVAFDVLIAVTIAIGMALPSTRRPACALGVLLFYFALMLPVDEVRAALTGTPERARHEAAVNADLAYMATRPGPTLCFDPALCWYAGRPPEFDPFNMGQQFSLGVRSPDTLVAALAARRFALVELSGDARTGPGYALPPPAWAALTGNYQVDRTTEDRMFLVPRR